MALFEALYEKRCRIPICYDHVFLRVSHTIRVGRALRAKKLTPKFIGSYQILHHRGPVDYELALSPQLSGLHNIFHVSQLRKYVPDPSHVIKPDAVEIRDDLLVEVPATCLEDTKVKELRGKFIQLVKVV
ncbi:uncharacterized protein LOC113859500 [Abrus precatorius]|uniref:Uncharacterized protein LOC113859500 n=1 Tax=Abrus precatorius TaxID=3816 RepID=A0A8B8L098_ABRPR|nr:uncharacterized protein LOC113859500 [Abrus precatorius]